MSSASPAASANVARNTIATWGKLGDRAVRDVVAAASGASWRVTDLAPTDDLGRLLFDARDTLSGRYVAAVVSVEDPVADAAVLLAAVQGVLRADLHALFVVTADTSAVRDLLAMGEHPEMLAVLSAIEEGRIRLWTAFDVEAFRFTLAHQTTGTRPDGDCEA
jgi:hypothetical protein